MLTLADAGTSQVLVLRGEPGIGKTALLRHVTDRADGWRVVSAVGVESEMELAYSGLHQLCSPLLEHVDGLPVPQREALRTVFGMSAGATPDRFLVGLAVLSLLSDVAEHQPLLCIVDDAHWLDQASAQLLAFVARRLLAERVAIVCAARAGVGDHVLAGLPELPVHGLSDDDARTLLLGNVRGPMDAAVLDRIIAETHGNPLALLELPRSSALGLAGGFRPPDGLSLAETIGQGYLERLADLPPDARLLLLVAAAEPIGDAALLWRAAAILHIGPEAGASAEDTELVRLGPSVRFRHPLVRSTVYRTASAEDQRSAHAALAEASDPARDPDRRAWHRAQATAGTDEETAADLERCAGRAQARGGIAAAAAFLERAVRLTPDPARRAARALATAQAMLLAGATDDANALLAVAAAGPLDELQQAGVQLLRGQLAFASSEGRDAPPLLLAAAHELETLDATLARDTYLDALAAGLFVGRLAGEVSVKEIAVVARRVARPEAAAPDLLLDALSATIADGYPVGAPLLHRAVDAFRAESLTPNEAIRWLWLATHAAHDVWDDDGWAMLSGQHIQLARQAGALTILPLALSARIGLHLFAGELAIAASLAEEVAAVAEATGNRLPPYAAMAVAAFRGREAEATALIDAAMSAVHSRGEGMGLSLVQHAQAVLYNGLGRYRDALSAAAHAIENGQELGFANWSLVQLIEAAVRSGEDARAADAYDKLRAMTLACGGDWALGVEARSRALLSQGDDAEDSYREAIDRLSRTRLALELARTRLLYGEWLRRAGRRAQAREELRTAHTAFIEMGAEAFAERARRELLATGETVRARSVVANNELTAQESQIARLVIEGRTNPEIAAELFLSPRTVEWHLRKVFSKLDITSRRQLRLGMIDRRRLVTT